ncbi:hypothetical protein Barb4_05117 [Bacteroidales bacterium Barb4]|nr:hypothetical protein Barb4_05117 [Bacteroidales bacterium Barb4]
MASHTWLCVFTPPAVCPPHTWLCDFTPPAVCAPHQSFTRSGTAKVTVRASLSSLLPAEYLVTISMV